MSNDNSITNVSGTNPLIGIHTFLSAVANGRYSKDGIELPGAEIAHKISLDILMLTR